MLQLGVVIDYTKLFDATAYSLTRSIKLKVQTLTFKVI